MYFFNQIVLFATALAATSDRGTVLDLTCRPPRKVPEPDPGPWRGPAAADHDDRE